MEYLGLRIAPIDDVIADVSYQRFLVSKTAGFCEKLRKEGFADENG
jgi:hypothetical protein